MANVPLCETTWTKIILTKRDTTDPDYVGTFFVSLYALAEGDVIYIVTFPIRSWGVCSVRASLKLMELDAKKMLLAIFDAMAE